MSARQDLEPEGPLVSTTPALSPSQTSILGNSLPPTCVQSVTLVPLSESHTKDLYANLGGPQNAHLYRYIPGGPHSDLASFTEHIKVLISGGLFFPFTIFKHDSTHLTNQSPEGNDVKRLGRAIGIICLMAIVPEHRRIEIGHVVFSPLLQRTTAGTESIYLLMKHCFEDLGHRRVEWKADNLNEPSKRAALRLGFVPEGVFRNHMIVKGRNRDTTWFSVTDGEWPAVKEALEEWLEKSNFDNEGRQKRKLEEIREVLAAKREGKEG
jgi:RimJ/RimL family protein N-acetyltransferase